MNCTPSYLASASRCWCLPDDRQRAAQIFLLCRWASANPISFYWSPGDSNPFWRDKNGDNQGDYADFLANADLQSVTQLDFSGSLGSKITVLKVSSPVLMYLDCSYNNLSDITLVCPNLEQLLCAGNQLTNSNFLVGLGPALWALQCDTNPITSIDFSPVPGVQSLNCSLTLITHADLRPMTDLRSVLIDGTVNMSSVDMTGLVDLGTASPNVPNPACDLSSNVLLTSLDTSTNVHFGDDLNGAILDNDSFTQVSVDDVVHQAVLHGFLNGFITFVGGFNATPSAAGLADIAILKGRGWNVLYNP